MVREPAGHRLLVQRDNFEKVTEGGIILATDEKLEKLHINRGTILKVGPTCWLADWLGGGKVPWCKEGDRIYFAKYAGAVCIDEETKEEFLLINDEDVLMIIKEDDNV